MDKRNVIIVTDGDLSALRAVEVATANIGGRCISLSAGSPTPLTGPQLVELVKSAPYDPVVIMVDDNGKSGTGRGEAALAYIATHPDVNVLGVLAVASDTYQASGVNVDFCIDREGNLTAGAVDKDGIEKPARERRLLGDTVDVVRNLCGRVVVGMGDVGKMEGRDDFKRGAPVTTRALREIITRSGFHARNGKCRQNEDFKKFTGQP